MFKTACALGEVASAQHLGGGRGPSEPTGDERACDRGSWWTTVVGVGVEVPPDVVDQLVSGHMPAPLIRVDFSDDEAWEELLQRAGRPYPPDDFQAMLQPLSDERLDGLEGSDLAGLDDRIFTVYLADERAMTGDERTVLVVDPRRSPVPSFRVALPALAAVENNLTLANVDFDDFARAVDEDGVFRGFMPSAARGEAQPGGQLRRAFTRPIPEQPMTDPIGVSEQSAVRSDAASGAFLAVAIGAPEDAEASARRTLQRMRSDAIAEHQPHYGLLQAAYPSPPEFEERAAVLTVLIETLSPADVVTLFRLLYNESGTAVPRQVELITDGATVDQGVLLTVRDRLKGVGWPAD